MKEIWKDIPGYEDYYQISNNGNVRSVNRTFVRKDGKVKTFKGRLLKQGTNPGGYKYVNLSVGSRPYCAMVHKLVAQSFLDNPDRLPCINHKDENKINNRAENLEWCTFAYNNTYNNKQLCQATKVCQYSKEGRLIAEFESIAEAERTVIGRRSNIGACCSGRTKTCGGYVWKYA